MLQKSVWVRYSKERSELYLGEGLDRVSRPALIQNFNLTNDY